VLPSTSTFLQRRSRRAAGALLAWCALLALPLVGRADQVPVASRPRPPGALSGKTVFLSPGHGFYHHDSLGWITQRGNSNDIVEDFLTSELTCQYLAAYLENAGADVWTCRDRCPSTVEVIVDDGDPGYAETGSWSPTSSGGYQGDGRFATVTAGETATATFTPDIPESGLYPLYVHFTAGSNRTSAAVVRVRHTGGEAEVPVNQERDGVTWRYVGTFYWFRGTAQSVVISNRAAPGGDGGVVIADAIRIGGGVGSMPPNAGGAPSGRRRADECSVYWARYQGAPPSVHDASDSDANDDVLCRPLYAEFESEPGEDSIYISVHSNAGGGTGTETYMYLDGTPEGSERLRDLIQAEIVADLRAEWDPSWTDRGGKTANFGELRLLSEIPGVLVETAFHDNPDDAAAEREPRWRRLVARAIYQAAAKHFAGSGAALVPEPPRRLVARGEGASAVLSWAAPAGGGGPPAGYRVYRSPNGLAFDGGTPASGTSAEVGGLLPGSTTFFRVTAVNAGGESFPSGVAAVRVPLSDEAPRVLIVSGYERLDAGLNARVAESSALGTVDRQILDRRMNTFDYAVEHALAFAAAPFDLAVDTSTSASVEDGSVPLGDYDLADWFTGAEDPAHDTLAPGERARIQEYLDSGGNLLLSGAAIGTDLALTSSAAARAFFTTWLKADAAAEGAGSHEVRSADAAAFTAQEGFLLSDASGPVFDAGLSDVYSPLGGALAALAYAAGPVGAAGVQFRGAYGLVHLGFPFESVRLPGARELLAARAARFLLEPPSPPPAASIAVEPPGGVVRLAAGRAEVILDGSGSRGGDGGGPEGLAFRWRKLQGPAGDRIDRPSGWEQGPLPIGYGDGDDATVLADMRGAYLSVFLVREVRIESAAALRGARLRILHDDGFAAYLNGSEIARGNLAPGAAFGAPAGTAIEPEEAVVDLGERLGLFRDGRNLLAVEVHNAAADSSDLTLSAELTIETPAGLERPVPSGASWFFHRGRTAPPPGWNGLAFEPTPQAVRVELTQAGLYRYELEVDGSGESATRATAEAIVVVLPEGGAGSFHRGDADGGGTVDISDAILVLNWLFAGGGEPACIDAADADDGGGVDITDALRVLTWLFSGGTEPAPPGPGACGLDPSDDALAPCLEPSGC
jgi:N-acetylmuramoyl-L-alanine amidase